MPGVTAPPRIKLQNILFATDFSPSAQLALSYTLNLAHRYDAGVYLVNVLPHLPFVESVQPDPEQIGLLPAAFLILACGGFGNETAGACFKTNSLNLDMSKKVEAEKSSGVGDRKKDEPTRWVEEVERMVADKTNGKQQSEVKKPDATVPPSTPEQRKQALVFAFGALINDLKMRKKLLDVVKKVKQEATSALAIVPLEGSDHFSRAETAERRFYRALAMLMTVQADANVIPSLPGPLK